VSVAGKGFFPEAATAGAAGAEPTRLDARAALAHGVARLREAGVASLGREAGLAAELLLLHVMEMAPKNDEGDAEWSGERAAGGAGEIEHRRGAHGGRRDRAWLYAHPEYVLSTAEWEAYEALLARRASGVPVQYLTGVQEFWGLEFEVTPSVLIPRPETEHVVEVALERVRARGIGGIDGAPSVAPLTPAPCVAADAALNIADVGTGSGCLAVALAKELPGARVVATDISAAALEVARRNALRHGVGERVRFVRADLLDLLDAADAPRGGASGLASATLAGREGDGEVFSQFFHHGSAGESPLFDLIVSNPPYVARNMAATLAVEVRDYEPHEALFGGATGVEIYARLIAQASGALRAGGVLVLELGYDSLAHVQALLARPDAAPDGAAAGRNSSWSDIRVTNDLAGTPRVISATR
jgi:release factor glutamine methyltransferase